MQGFPRRRKIQIVWSDDKGFKIIDCLYSGRIWSLPLPRKYAILQTVARIALWANWSCRRGRRMSVHWLWAISSADRWNKNSDSHLKRLHKVFKIKKGDCLIDLTIQLFIYSTKPQWLYQVPEGEKRDRLTHLTRNYLTNRLFNHLTKKTRVKSRLDPFLIHQPGELFSFLRASPIIVVTNRFGTNVPLYEIAMLKHLYISESCGRWVWGLNIVLENRCKSIFLI